jgi:hypothetical protein
VLESDCPLLGISRLRRIDKRSDCTWILFGAPVWVPDPFYTYWRGPYFNFGGGGEAPFGKGFAIAGEAAGLIALQEPGRNAAVLSLNAAFHPIRAGKIDPFVTAGFSLLVGRGTSGAVNYGGGFHYWFARRFGFRLELRDVAFGGDELIHLVGVRFGLSIRSAR